MEKYSEILERMTAEYERESGHRADDVSDTGLRMRVLAGEIYRLENEVDWLERQLFPHTATGEWLDRHGEQRGVKRVPAVCAEGTLTFSRYLPLSFDLVIPAGTVCAISGDEPTEYATDEEVTLSAGELTVDAHAKAVIGGKCGNASAGSISSPVSVPTGINYVTNKAAFSDGKDAESDSEYRGRVLSAYADPPNGSNCAYYKSAAMSVSGVGAAGAVPVPNGAGTVGVYIWGENGAPDEPLLNAVKSELSRRREIGVEVTVQAASTKSVDVGVRIKLCSGADFTVCAENIKSAVASHFAEKTVGSAVCLAEIERAVLNAAPIVEFELYPSMRGIAAEESVLPVLGTVTVEELE